MFTQLSYRKRGPNLYSFRWRAEVKSNHSEFYPKVVVWKREQDDQPSNLVNGIPHLQIYITVMYIYIYVTFCCPVLPLFYMFDPFVRNARNGQIKGLLRFHDANGWTCGIMLSFDWHCVSPVRNGWPRLTLCQSASEIFRSITYYNILYPLVNKYGKSPFSMGKSTIDSHFQ